MGCNTSSEAKTEQENQGEKETQNTEQNTKENHTNENHTNATDKTSPVTEEKAATKIQAAFRGHKTRKSVKEMSMKAAAPEPEPTTAELEAEFRADDKELCNAATKIQASFRGHQARKVTEAEKKEQQDKEDVEKIDLTDPDLNKAATKIQASFRGHKVRKDVPN